MTPEEARKLLEGTSPAPWVIGTQTNCTKATEFWITDRYDKQVAEQETLARNFDETESDFTLMAAAPGMAAMIAGMRTEWGVHVTGYPKNIADWWEICDDPVDSIEWFADEEAAEDFATEREDDGFDTRIVRRYVTAPQPLEGEHP